MLGCSQPLSRLDCQVATLQILKNKFDEALTNISNSRRPVKSSIHQVFLTCAFRKPPCQNGTLVTSMTAIFGWRATMGLVIPKLRKHLCADALLRSIQDVFCQIPDHRKGDAQIPLHDALMSAFAMFSLKAPSLLAFDKERDRRQPATRLRHWPKFRVIRRCVRPSIRLNPSTCDRHLRSGFVRFNAAKSSRDGICRGHYLLALDGTGYFSSKEIHCESCLEKHHKNGAVTYSHQMLGAAFIHPDKREVIPFMPEPIVKQDGIGEK